MTVEDPLEFIPHISVLINHQPAIPLLKFRPFYIVIVSTGYQRSKSIQQIAGKHAIEFTKTFKVERPRHRSISKVANEYNISRKAISCNSRKAKRSYGLENITADVKSKKRDLERKRIDFEQIIGKIWNTPLRKRSSLIDLSLITKQSLITITWTMKNGSSNESDSQLSPAWLMKTKLFERSLVWACSNGKALSFKTLILLSYGPAVLLVD